MVIGKPFHRDSVSSSQPEHFLSALFSDSNGFEKALETFEEVTTDEERLAIAELTTDVRRVSMEVQDGMLLHSCHHIHAFKIS